MNCLHCHTAIEETAEDKEKGGLAEMPFCSWECFRDDERGLRWHLNALPKKERERFLRGKGLKDEEEAKKKFRWVYHEGGVGPRAGSKEAREAEEKYREKMRESCKRRPPRLRGASLCSAEDMGSPTVLPSEVYFGKSDRRVLGESDIKLGSEDGDNYNFHWE